jgi:general secretion pathway protein G
MVELERTIDTEHQWYVLLRIWKTGEMCRKKWSLKGSKITRGFTLIEVIIVIAIMAILTAIAVPLFAIWREKAQVAVAISGVRMIEQTITGYVVDKSEYPVSLADVGLGAMKDPWGNPYRYLKIYGLGNKVTGSARKDRFMVPINTDFDLYSMGPDGVSASALTAKVSQDDIIRANDGGYVGTAAEY